LSTATKIERPTKFEQLNLNDSVLAAVTRAGYVKPTPIQAYLIPRAVAGRDVLGQAQTGTGKTAAFLLPYFNNWQPNRGPGPSALVMAPTRELVIQIHEEAEKLRHTKDLKAVAIYGGQRFSKQTSAMRSGFDLAVGTPGRILDHLGRGTLSLAGIRFAVLDEADRMLDIGFRPDIEKILRRCPHDRQTLLLSATLPAEVLRLAVRYMINPIHINLAPKKVTVDKIKQTYITVSREKKFDLLLKILEREQPRQCIIFCERKIWAQNLCEDLSEHHVNVGAMHGNLAQSERESIMKNFRSGDLHILVATDVVGRGIDVTGISHIINFDLPEDPENYVHRIGRTGRMGKDGIAIAFVTPEQGEQLTRIEQFINKQLESEQIEGFEAFATKKDDDDTPEARKPHTPIFGRRSRKYSNRL
jgi:ATP-dependent RNA helicase DeaD